MADRETLLFQRAGKEALAIPYTLQTLRTVPNLIPRKPTLGNSLPPCYVQDGETVTGCVVSRLTTGTVPEMMLLVCGEVTEEGHEIGTRDLYYRDLTVTQGALPKFDGVFQLGTHARRYPDLQVVGFSLRGDRDEALTLKMNLRGSEVTVGQEPDEIYTPAPERFFFFNGMDLSLGDEILPDVAAFALEGNYDYDRVGEKRTRFMVRRRERDSDVFTGMRGTVTFQMVCSCPQEYEKERSGRLLLYLDAVFQGEESFRDDNGIQSREFRYLVSGLTIRVFLTGAML